MRSYVLDHHRAQRTNPKMPLIRLVKSSKIL